MSGISYVSQRTHLQPKGRLNTKVTLHHRGILQLATLRTPQHTTTSQLSITCSITRLHLSLDIALVLLWLRIRRWVSGRLDSVGCCI